jgi:predicted ABC-type ATPase
MKITELILESRNINIQKLDSLVKNSKTPIYIVVAGSVGSGKSFVVKRDLNIDTIDPDEFTMALGKGVYDGKNVAKSMSMVKKSVSERLSNKQTFLQQGTSANLQSTINKLKKAKEMGFKTVLLYVDAPIEQALKQIEKRVSGGGHGATIDRKKVENTSKGAELTFRALSGVDFDKATEKDLERVEKALEKTEKTIDKARRNLDYFIRIENKY